MKKWMSILMLFVLCLTLFSGCAGAPEQESKVVTVYTLAPNAMQWSMNDVYRYTLDQFADSQEDVILDIVEFSDPAAMDAQLLEELQQGMGPDLILYSWQNSFDLHKLAAQGYFRDLSAYLEEDTGFDRESYNEALLNEGLYGEAQFLLPLGFEIPMVLTTEERLADAGYSYEGNALSASEILAIIADEAERWQDDAERFAYVDLQYGNSLSFFVVASGIVRMDYENQTVELNREDLKKLVEYYNVTKTEHDRAMAEIGGNPHYENDPNRRMSAGTIYHCVISPLEEMLRAAVILEGNLAETPVLQYQSGFADAGRYYVRPLMAAVNQYSDAPAAAYEVIRFLMDTPIEQGTAGMARPSYPSANRDVAQMQFDAAFRSATNQEPGQSEQYSRFLAAFESMLYGEMLDMKFPTAAQSLMGDCTRTYREDPSKMDAAIDTLIEELNAYLAE